ncbi:MAG: thioredoxin domain-containing protein [Crocinitomicaceae bacterium]
MQDSSKKANALIHESSPYLLQHAYNPVNWVSWSDSVFQKAASENKLVLISVGYSSCHWCHVMEHESFEDETVAKVMNQHFISVKVDREERPDVDQVYMSAVQLMTGQGGWPLNCIVLPNGKPIYGGTYFRKEQWIQILEKLADLYRTEPERLAQYAEEVAEGIRTSELVRVKENKSFAEDKLDEILINWKRRFDNIEGGPNKAPKFPLPNNYDFLLRTFYHNRDENLRSHIELTLDKMACGGIFDQIGGGFARYSVDALWKVPHFEKMLYDNGQLIGLYADAFKVFQKDHYQEVVEKTFQWLESEMKDESGAYYSALDADSEGEEGKFYVWKESELMHILGDDYLLGKEVYQINSKGFWEHGNYILHRNENLTELADRFQLSENVIQRKIQAMDAKLLLERNKRIHPGLDDKCLTAWNALLISGLTRSYQAFGKEKYLERAESIAQWIQEIQYSNGVLHHTYKKGKSTIEGFLDDYATCIQAFLDLYEVTFKADYFEFAKELLNQTDDLFLNKENELYFFTTKNAQLIHRKTETEDNVIPSTNSIMARNLFRIGTLMDDEKLTKQSQKMLTAVYDGMEQYGSAYSNWGLLLLDLIKPVNEIVIAGKNWKNQLVQIQKKYIPNALFLGGESNTINSPLAEGKLGQDKIFVCQNKTCKLPVDKVEEALGDVVF